MLEFKKIEIPKIFRKYEDGELFTECIVCKKKLIESNEDYIIEKAIRNYPEKNVQDVIFEYAMCFECMEKMKSEFSEESLQRIENYFSNKVDLTNRLLQLDGFGEDFNKFIENCVVTGEPVSQSKEYVIQGHCSGDKMLLSLMPIAISERVYDEVSDLLSNKTLDFLNGFMDDFIDYPPEFRDIFNKRLILF